MDKKFLLSRSPLAIRLFQKEALSYLKKGYCPGRQKVKMQAKRFFFEKKKQKTFIHCRRHGVRTENSVPSETDKSFLVLFCKKERVASLRFQWVDLPGQRRKKKQKLFIRSQNGSATLGFGT